MDDLPKGGGLLGATARSIIVEHERTLRRRRVLVQYKRFEIRLNRKGRGLYATDTFHVNELVTEDPVIVFKNGDADGVVHRYTFEWDAGVSALALGPGSIINHSYSPNVVYDFDWQKKTILFRALRIVVPGEELTMNYNCDPLDKSPVGFRVKS